MKPVGWLLEWGGVRALTALVLAVLVFAAQLVGAATSDHHHPAPQDFAVAALPDHELSTLAHPHVAQQFVRVIEEATLPVPPGTVGQVLVLLLFTLATSLVAVAISSARAGMRGPPSLSGGGRDILGRLCIDRR
ncbi:hypothetical protein ACFU44_08165 [Nocardia rhizosphaerihabitans]|uniref:hypothetical protein n=1 Tax=Nocardia rhizosphaerihabitans TaxID=1691570 RepID=UPI00366ECC23